MNRLTSNFDKEITLKLDPFETLNESVEKFQQRYDLLVKLVNQDGLLHLKNKPLNILLDYWDKAKKATKDFT